MVEQRPSWGAIWIRLAKMPREQRAERLATTIQNEQTNLLHMFTILYPEHIEQHPLPSNP
jgi:hypothetical protein